MLKHALFLLFLYGIKNVSSSPQEKAAESSEVFKNGIKKNEVGANGHEANWEKITRNFQNPVLEYLLRNNADRMTGPPSRGVVREIRHSQTLLVPNFLAGPLSGALLNQLPQIHSFHSPGCTYLSGSFSTSFWWGLYTYGVSVPIGVHRHSAVNEKKLHL